MSGANDSDAAYDGIALMPRQLRQKDSAGMVEIGEVPPEPNSMC